MEAQFECPSDGEIRALIDDAVPDARRAVWAEHVAACDHCRARLDLISENADAVAAKFSAISAAVAAVDENAALRKMRARRELREPVIPLLKGEWLMSRIAGVGRRGALAGVAVIALMVVVIAAVPLGSLAENMLTRLRVQQFSAITIPMDMVQPKAQASGSTNSGMQAFVAAQLADLGKLNTTLDKSSLSKASSVADAQSHLNGSMLVPTDLSSFSGARADRVPDQRGFNFVRIERAKSA